MRKVIQNGGGGTITVTSAYSPPLNGEKLHLTACKNCSKIVVMTHQEFQGLPFGLVLETLNKNVGCCGNPNYSWESISTLPEITSRLDD